MSGRPWQLASLPLGPLGPLGLMGAQGRSVAAQGCQGSEVCMRPSFDLLGMRKRPKGTPEPELASLRSYALGT
jgi:hypothetical protein